MIKDVVKNEDALFDCINGKMAKQKQQEKDEKNRDKIEAKKKKELIQDIKNFFNRLDHSGRYDFETPLGMMRVEVNNGFWDYFLYKEPISIKFNKFVDQKNIGWNIPQIEDISTLSIKELEKINLHNCMWQLGREKGCIKERREMYCGCGRKKGYPNEYAWNDIDDYYICSLCKSKMRW